MSLWLSVDPLMEKMPDWSPYAYTFNNPINFVDPTGMEGEGVDWKKNKNGTYTAGKGDSAASLAKDANISPERANELVESQLGKNYKGADGEMKSNVEVGDIVAVPEQVEKYVKEQQIDKSIEKDKLLIEKNKSDISSLENAKKVIDEDHKLTVEVGAYDGQQGDNSRGLRLARILVEERNNKRKAKFDVQIDKKKKTNDSLNNEIKRKQKDKIKLNK